MRYTIFIFLVSSFLMTSCYTPKPISEHNSRDSKEIEIIKRLERPGDGAYFASSEAELQPRMDFPEWDIPELVPIENIEDEPSTPHRIIRYAKTYQGTPYKFGGTTKKGMDCSGLVYTSFKEEDIYLPRVSSDMAKEGKRINLNHAQPGDLLFFKTNRSRNVINHVGIVVETNGDDIRFIHSSTSRGVIISSITETYWQRAFSEARRVL